MKITTNLLRKFGADENCIKFMEKFYPDGAEPLEIVKDHKIPLEYLHFARKYFPFTNEEFLKYKELCNIDENSTNFWASSDVEHSQCVWRSKLVSDSGYIIDSNTVKNSQFVFNSVDVRDSSNLLLSRSVRKSEKIMNSQFIDYSEQVNFSENVHWSKYITYSQRISDSEFLYKCERVTNSYFCGFLKDCNTCLFCDGLEGADSYIFNKPVSRNDFERVMDELLFHLRNESIRFIEVDYKNSYERTRFKTKNRLDDIFNGLSSDFYGWISTLPNYEDNLFLSLFFKEK